MELEYVLEPFHLGPIFARSELPRILLYSLKSHFTKLESQFAPLDNSLGSEAVVE